jgi:hypothetical protein
MKYFLLALTATLLFIASCEKSPTVTPNRENLLRAKNWRISGGTLRVRKPNGIDTNLEYLRFVDSCYLDDYIKFDSLYFGSIFTNDIRCNPADPTSRAFTWRLTNNDKFIELNDGFNIIFAVTTTIEPYRIETLSTSPLVLDTLIGRLDTIPGFIKEFIVLDTIRELRFNKYPLGKFDILGAEITNFTESSFTLNFSFKTTRLDSTNLRAGMPNNNPPITLPDTADYSLFMTAF